MNLADRIIQDVGSSPLARRLPRAVLYVIDGLVGRMIDTVNLDTLPTRDQAMGRGARP